jgi:hypothetical protein
MKNNLEILEKVIEFANSENYRQILSMKKGGIYIKPENRGKFTATKKRTGKTTEELAHSKNPLTRKRAIFALNVRK